MPRLRRSTSTSRDATRQPSDSRKLERARSSNLNTSKPCRWRLRCYWRAFVVVCGCITVVLLSVPRSRHSHLEIKTKSMFRPRFDACPAEDDWSRLPQGIALDVHVVARGSTENLRTTLQTLASACFPEDPKLALHVWMLTAHAGEVIQAQDGFVWTHGTYQFHTISTKYGNVPPLEGWARMWTDAGEDEVRLVLPEGLEMSKLFYFWLVGTLGRYMGETVTLEEYNIFRENVFGISLSATGLSEVSGRPMSWEAYQAADEKNPIFHTLPGSRGTAFFGWQWLGFANFIDTRTRILDADSWEGEPLLPAHGGEAVQSWAGSLERFLGEYGHARGLGILHPNLNGGISFARQAPSGAAWGEVLATEEGVSTQAEGASTPQPTLRGSERMVKALEGLVMTRKDASTALRRQPAVSVVPAYDLMFQRHPDLTHLRLLAYRFMSRLQTSSSRNEELEGLWRRPQASPPVFEDVKYLIYQPQFGMGNQLRALEAGLAVARVLGRMLVVPDYISENGEGRPVRYDSIWEFGFLKELVGQDKVILQADFDALLEQEGVIEPPTRLYMAEMPIKQLSGTDEYFGRMGWAELPHVPLPMANATEAGWRGVHIEDQVLAVSAMFGMFEGWTEDSPVGDQHWHSMVKLHVSEESTWLHDFVEDSLDRFRRKAESASKGHTNGSHGRDAKDGGSSAGGPETQFMCAHIRRQDFKASCGHYEEEYKSGSARAWVNTAFGSGGLCWVKEADFRKTIHVLLQQAPQKLGVEPHFVFATSDDERFLDAIKDGNGVPVFTLDDVLLPKGVERHGQRGRDMESVPTAAGRVLSAEELRAALPAVDVAVCSRAAVLLLNYFSTYSALIKAKAKAQPNFVRGLYWADPPALSLVSWSTKCLAWLHRLFHRY